MAAAAAAAAQAMSNDNRRHCKQLLAASVGRSLCVVLHAQAALSPSTKHSLSICGQWSPRVKKVHGCRHAGTETF